MNFKIENVELSTKKIIPVWGGTKIGLTYLVNTSVRSEGTTNTYEIEGECRVNSPNDIFFVANKVIAFNNNQNTLTAEALLDHLEWEYESCLEFAFKKEDESVPLELLDVHFEEVVHDRQ